MDESLTPAEQLALAGLLRMLVRLDGTLSPEEAASLPRVVPNVLRQTVTERPYRESAIAAEDDATIDDTFVWELFDRAARELPDEAAVRRAAQAVTREAAREAIYGALYEVASADVIVGAEWTLLDWVAKEWGIAASVDEGAP